MLLMCPPIRSVRRRYEYRGIPSLLKTNPVFVSRVLNGRWGQWLRVGCIFRLTSTGRRRISCRIRGSPRMLWLYRRPNLSIKKVVGMTWGRSATYRNLAEVFGLVGISKGRIYEYPWWLISLRDPAVLLRFLVVFSRLRHLSYILLAQGWGFLGLFNCCRSWFDELIRFQIEGVLLILYLSGNLFADVFHDSVLLGLAFLAFWYLVSACATVGVAYFSWCSASSSRCIPYLHSIFLFYMVFHFFYVSSASAHY